MTFFTKRKRESAGKYTDRTRGHSFRQIPVCEKPGRGSIFWKNGMNGIPIWNGSEAVSVGNLISAQRQFIDEIPVQLAVPVTGAAD